jgi:hypothetical protein
MLNYISLHSIVGVKHLVLILLGLGLVGCVVAIMRTGSRDSRAQIWASLCVGVITGAAVTLGVLVVQQWLAEASAAALWRANMQAAPSLPGFTPAGHSLRGLVFSGKDLHDAELYKAHLEGLKLRDTNLLGADLRGAYLQRANLIGADLRTAELDGAHLQGANLQAARLDFASVEHAASFAGAHADAATCWPAGFLELSIARGIIAVPYDNGQGQKITIPGRESPHCLTPRQPLPALRG